MSKKWLEIVTKSVKTFLYCFASSYTILNFDEKKLLESVLIAFFAASFVTFDVLSRKKYEKCN